MLLIDKRGFQGKGTTWFQKYFDELPDLRSRLFNLFAVVGILIGLCVTPSNIIIGAQPVHIALNLVSSAVAAFLLWYANKTGRFELCYIVTIVLVFLVFFPVLFFTAGGYRGGIPSFFVFAVTFTAMILRGRKNREIASEIAYSLDGVKKLAGRIYDKTGLSRDELRDSVRETVTRPEFGTGFKRNH
jgi:hypothetical protein